MFYLLTQMRWLQWRGQRVGLVARVAGPAWFEIVIFLLFYNFFFELRNEIILEQRFIHLSHTHNKCFAFIIIIIPFAVNN